MVTLRLISIGLSGALTVTQLVSGTATTSPAARRTARIERALLFISLLAWLSGCGGYVDLVDRGRALLLFFLAEDARLGDDAGRIERERHHRGDDRRRILEALGHLDQRSERAVDVEVHLQRHLLECPAHDARQEAALVRERDLPDREARRELARQVAVEPDGHRAVPDLAEQVEGEAGDHPRIRLCAGVAELAARRAGIEPATDNAPAGFVEDHREHAVGQRGEFEGLEGARRDG